ncbi:MAG TPA: hypothetical protein VKN99_11135 [Polyangia bacterium]|nr:hypothetical protein [Polyangia bacterium]
MMVAEEVLAQVVTEVSQSHGNPRFVEETVGAFMRRQPIVGNYIASHQGELGVEGVVLTLLHAAIVARAVERAAGRKLPALEARHLDAAAQRGPNVDGFRSAQPAIYDYLGANVADDATLATPERRDQALLLLRVVSAAMAEQL